ncbi:MBL fold metallo-hydrolase [Pelagibacterium xiamenense]|uniref:MBL fold metallo-hydrolase n=1 Tax=Pelagibacterium xiamenense TaxID=2901140 RepID=UPI001E57C4C6|nr:MBL fold metallo-hydrolase [Pelagibacterium xiamenense]MCD7058356.1 MBL fold metallo-hydrolase [Pelagibacterium xiamenense]
MTLSRRTTLRLGATTLAGLGLSAVMPRIAFTQNTMGDTYETDDGTLTVSPISHASLVLTTPSAVIYADPVGGAALYEGHPPPDLILVTHEHGDHYDPDTLSSLIGPDTRIVANPAVFDMLPEALAAQAEAIGNGESTSFGDIGIDAIPAYNTTEDRLQYHPQGRDNGYVLTIGDTRVYIAGDTEDIPEMRALENIDIAFVPMNLPYTMDEAQAASGVGAFAPAVVYPYHYRGSDLDLFEDLLGGENVETEVVRGPWYEDA